MWCQLAHTQLTQWFKIYHDLVEALKPRIVWCLAALEFYCCSVHMSITWHICEHDKKCSSSPQSGCCEASNCNNTGCLYTVGTLCHHVLHSKHRTRKDCTLYMSLSSLLWCICRWLMCLWITHVIICTMMVFVQYVFSYICIWHSSLIIVLVKLNVS